MIRPVDINLYNSLKNQLEEFHRLKIPLLGIKDQQKNKCFIMQIIESIRRIKYINTLNRNPIEPDVTNPLNEGFNPLKAAIFNFRNGNFEEACWLVFLYVHFGESRQSGWPLTKSFYNKLGQGSWDWQAINSKKNTLQQWLSQNEKQLQSCGKFGNHRKYQSIKPTTQSGVGTAEVIESYIGWVEKSGSHMLLLKNLHNRQFDPQEMFEHFYQSLDEVKSFGRVAKFDYLSMMGKLSFFPVEPGHPYLINSTGPINGAKLLFGDHNSTPKSLNQNTACLGNHLNLNSDFKMQILEDALCNWQKSPGNFIPFRN